MATYTIADGLLTISCPPGYGIQFPGEPPAPRRGGRGPKLPSGPVPLPTVDASADPILNALADQGLDLVAPVDLAPTPAATGTRAPKGTARLQLSVAADEDAVVLLEHDGMYSWRLPTERVEQPVVTAHRGPSRPGARVTFDLDLGARPSRRNVPAGRRGLLTDLVFDRVRAYVLRFVARKVAGLAMNHLEAHIATGLVSVSSPDPADWRRVLDPASLHLPVDRPARILLLLHGTFSNTVGAFGALSAFKWGQQFLTESIADYDAVLGYDHRTLSVDPSFNAQGLLRALRAAGPAYPPVIDIVCHSRGALVARSLAEDLLPQEPQAARLRRIVFVAGTNDGTELADPRNWRTLIDLYTNLVAAAARAVALAPGATVVANLVRGLVLGLGAFVKYLVSYALQDDATEAGVPGLAAMMPTGPFVTTLNGTQRGQPTAADAPWYVITSDFEPRLFGDGASPGQLPKRLLTVLADGLVDQLMGEHNDLVVNTASMSAIDLPGGGGFVKDQYDFGTNGEVYHTTYFTRPEVCAALARWLELGAPSEVVPVGAMVRASLPVIADENIIVIDSTTSAGEVQGLLASAPGYVVLRHQPDAFYAYTRTELATRLTRLGSRAKREPVMHRLELHESDRSHQRGPVGWRQLPRQIAGGQLSGSRTVIFDAGEPIAVVPEPVRPASLEQLLTGRGDVATLPGERGRPRGPEASPPRGPTDKPIVPAHFQASMPDAVEVGKTVMVTCTVAREVLPAVPGVSDRGQASVITDRPIVVQVIAKAHANVVGDDRAEIPVPAQGQPANLYFDIRPMHAGQGEIWVVARQGPIPLVTLRLTPTFVAEGVQPPPGTTYSEATASTQAPQICTRQSLRITERQLGPATVYDYDLEAEDLKLIVRCTSAPLTGSRETYVANLYAKIEKAWVDNHEDVTAFGNELRALGATLFDELFPLELRQKLWRHREKLKNVLVYSTEPFIPWELVHLKKPDAPLPQNGRTWFLAECGLVRWLHGPWPTDHLQCRAGKARYLIPAYPHPDYALPAAQVEKQFLSTKLGATAVKADQNSVVKLLGRPGSFDVLHFAGHGQADPADIGNASIMLTGRVEDGLYVPDLLAATTVGQFANLVGKSGNRPLVVLNACQSGRLGQQLTGLGGFAKAFLGTGEGMGGAGAFISSLWSVGDRPAQQFTSAFYTAMLAGKTLAEASAEARATARAAGEATWLAYVVYGNPCATFTFQAIRPSKAGRQSKATSRRPKG